MPAKAHRWSWGLPVLLLLLGFSPARAEDGLTYDMDKAVQQALSASPQMVSADAQAGAAEMGRRSALGVFGPSLTTGYGYTRYDHERPYRSAPTQTQDVYAWTFNAHQILFAGFKYLSTYQKAALATEKAEANRRAAELSLIQSVQTNFLGLLKARENVRSAEDSLARLQSQLKVTQAFYDVGLKPRLDVLQAEVDLAGAEDSLLQARNAVATQITRLNTLLNLPVEKPVEYVGRLDKLPFRLTLEECLTRAYRDRPDMVMADKSVGMARKDSAIARSGMFPAVGADFDWSKSGDHPNVDGSPLKSTEYSAWSASVSASWTIFEWGQTWHSWRQAEETVRQMAAEAAALRDEVTYEVKSRFLKIDEASERITVARKALEAAQESYRMAEARYQAQVGTNTDVLDAQAKLSSAEATLTQALAEQQTALADLYAAIGWKNPALRAE